MSVKSLPGKICEFSLVTVLFSQKPLHSLINIQFDQTLIMLYHTSQIKRNHCVRKIIKRSHCVRKKAKRSHCARSPIEAKQLAG